MQIQKIINNLFRQNFKDRGTLGRALFGAAVFMVGWENLLHMSSYTNYAPDYIPFPSLAVLTVGILYIVAGFLIAANLHLKKATTVLGIIFALFIFVVYLPNNQILDVLQTLIIIGATLLVSVQTKEEVDEPEEIKAP